MAKYNPNKEKSVKLEYPSEYGSHSSMIDNEATQALRVGHLVALKDAEGLYITERVVLNTNLADPNRYMNRPKTVDEWGYIQEKLKEARI